MRLSFRHVLLTGSSAGIFLLASCSETAQSKKALAPAPQALAPAIQQPVAVTPPPQEQVKPPEPAKPDPVVAMVAEAEKAYQSGQANYKAGHLDAAKQDFDHAVDLLMQGPVSVKSDDRLQQEFDKITEEIHKLELVAFKAGDGFTEQQPEPAPIDEANQVTFPADANLTAKAEAELKTTTSDLPLMINEYVAGYISFYSTRGKGTFLRAAERAGRYREMISRIFKEEGVPQDLIYLAQAESGFHPLALSRAGARGMWQFMASRANGYGLQRSWWIDERQDPEKATRAAARHLKDLYNQFGDWYLAIAAYNSGPGNVQQAVRRTGYADFWELYKRNVLPKETKNYVPIILAFTVMAKNPGQYGLDKIQPALPLEIDTVRIDYPVDLRLVAECVDSDLNRLTELNPSLLRLTTPKGATYDLHLPAGTKEKFEQAIAAIPLDKRVSWRYHHVAQGDTLDSIARTYHTTPAAIRAVNALPGENLRADGKVVIPVTAGRLAGNGQLTYSHKPTRYRVRRGDTLASVADDFGVPAERLRRWNRLNRDRLAYGMVLVIYRPVASTQSMIINSPSRHRRAHRTSSLHKSGRASAAKAAANSQKSTGVKAAGGQSERASSSASEHASAGLQ